MTRLLSLTEQSRDGRQTGRRKVISRLVKGGMLAAGGGSGVVAHAADLVASPTPSQPGVVRRAYQPLAGDLRNPERGLIEWAGDLLEGRRREWLEHLVATAPTTFSLVRWSTDLGSHGYLDKSSIPDKALHRLSDNLTHMKRCGLKAAIRFMYSYPTGTQDYRNPPHPPLERMLGHIRQLGAVLQAHGGAIAFTEAGFIGPWGEWHSSELLDTPCPRNRIKDELLASFPGTILFRLPRHVREWYGDSILSEDGGSPEGRRIGLHNDSILSLQIHNGNTWRTTDFRATGLLANRADDRLYARRLSRYRPYGGEVAPNDPAPYLLKMSDPAAHATEDLRLHHFQFLNTGRGLEDLRAILDAHDPSSFRNWVRQLGYRFVLLEASCDETIERGRPFRITLKLRNEGASRIMHPRALQMRFLPVSADGQVIGDPHDVALKDIEPRNWQPACDGDRLADDSALFGLASVSALQPGLYHLGLRLPDPDPELALDSRYCVRLANAGTAAGPGQGWDATSGSFMLGIRIRVT